MEILRLPRDEWMLGPLLLRFISLEPGAHVAIQPQNLVSCGTKNKQSSSNIQEDPSLVTESRSSVKMHSATVHSFLRISQLKLKGQSKSLWQLNDSSTVCTYRIERGTNKICQQFPLYSARSSTFTLSLYLCFSLSSAFGSLALANKHLKDRASILTRHLPFCNENNNRIRREEAPFHLFLPFSFKR